MNDKQHIQHLKQIHVELEKGIVYLSNLAMSIEDKITALEQEQLNKDIPDLFDNDNN